MFSIFARKPKLLSVDQATPASPHERSDPLMDEVVQVCSYDVPAFTVVREDVEKAYVVDEVARHIDAVDEWTPDVFDYECKKRHQQRIADIKDQTTARHQDATRALAETEKVLTQLSLKVQYLQQQQRHLANATQGWADVLTGHNEFYEPAPVAASSDPVTITPLPTAPPLFPDTSLIAGQDAQPIAPLEMVRNDNTIDDTDDSPEVA